MDKSKFNMLIGDTLRDLREREKLSQEELASKSGSHTNYIGAIERGERSITVYKLYKILKALNIDLSDFFENI